MRVVLFSFEAFEPGVYDLQASFSGFQTKEVLDNLALSGAQPAGAGSNCTTATDIVVKRHPTRFWGDILKFGRHDTAGRPASQPAAFQVRTRLLFLEHSGCSGQHRACRQLRRWASESSEHSKRTASTSATMDGPKTASFRHICSPDLVEEMSLVLSPDRRADVAWLCPQISHGLEQTVGIHLNVPARRSEITTWFVRRLTKADFAEPKHHSHYMCPVSVPETATRPH